jgi:hypothetical protein
MTIPKRVYYTLMGALDDQGYYLESPGAKYDYDGADLEELSVRHDEAVLWMQANRPKEK